MDTSGADPIVQIYSEIVYVIFASDGECMIFDCMLGTSFGGLERVFLDQLVMLPSAGLDVRGVVQRATETAMRADAAGLPCDEISVLSNWDPITRARIRALVRRHNPELLLCHGRRAHRLFARAIGWSRPIVAMVHKPKFDRHLPFAGVVVVAEHRRRSLIEAGVSPDKIAAIPNAVHLPSSPKATYALPPGMPAHIAGLGRFHEKKGFGVLLVALRLLEERQIPFTCSIAGDGPLRKQITKESRQGALASKVVLPGWIDEVAGFLMSTDIFAFPSLQEDFPLAVLDAMSCGMPIVASCIDGPRDFLVDGETALLVAPNDPAALAEALARLIADTELRARLGCNARRSAVRSYGFDVIGRSLAGAVSNVLKGRLIGENLC